MISIWFKHDTLEIGGGTILIPNTATQWTEFTVDITFGGNIMPDTMNILFSSSTQKNNVPVGSALEIDHIWLEGGTLGYTRPMKVHMGFKLFPNPAKTFVKIVPEIKTRIDYVKVYSSTGALIIEETELGYTSVINTSVLSEGLYFVEVRADNTSVIEKLIIQ